jgi:hypothetical protein
MHEYENYIYIYHLAANCVVISWDVESKQRKVHNRVALGPGSI